jgi:hypothetical protein
MRKTLLIAAAALASGIISSQAGVYSQNIVGYANVQSTGFKNSFIEVPFAIGVSNGVNEVFGNTLPAGSYILLYANGAYTEALYDNTYGPGTPVWYQSDDTTPLTALPTIPPGLGFLLYTEGPTQTNTFAGAVAIPVGTSNNLVLNAYKNNAVGSVVPYAGAVTNGTSSTGGPNLNNLPAGSYLLFYSNGSFSEALYDNTYGPGTPTWYLSDDTTPYVDPTTGGNTPSIAVGQGFFIYPEGAYTWTTGL